MPHSSEQPVPGLRSNYRTTVPLPTQNPRYTRICNIKKSRYPQDHKRISSSSYNNFSGHQPVGHATTGSALFEKLPVRRTDTRLLNPLKFRFVQSPAVAAVRDITVCKSIHSRPLSGDFYRQFKTHVN